MKILKWISYEEAKSKQVSVGGLGGWFGKGDTWETYLATWGIETASYIVAIKDSVLRARGIVYGNEHQDDEQGVPLFEDDTVGSFTFRAWSDLMAAIATINDGPVHVYMDFYMRGD